MNETIEFLAKEISNDSNVVIGVSGGPDSMVALHLLISLKNEKNINIICAHVNHNLRKESINEAKSLEEYCKKNGLVFEMTKIENYGSNNFHNEARKIRYNFFEEIINKYNSPYLITAHHGDDLMETILMRLVRGSTLGGYAGFSRILKKAKYKILRPLIMVTKEEILKYAADNDIEYATDASNVSDKYTRNRYRKYVLPFLKEENASVHEKFLKFSQTLIKYNNYIELEIKKHLPEIYIDNTLYIGKFIQLDSVLQEKIIDYILEDIYCDDLILINDTHTDSILKLIYSKRPNIYLYLPNNIKAIKSYDRVVFEVTRNEDNTYKLELDNINNLPNGKTMEIAESSEDDSNNICRLDTDEIKMPLIIRTKNTGDRMQIKGMIGSKKIKDIFINTKISSFDRDSWPILADSDDNILWLPGLKKSKYDKSKKEKHDIIIKYY